MGRIWNRVQARLTSLLGQLDSDTNLDDFEEEAGPRPARSSRPPQNPIPIPTGGNRAAGAPANGKAGPASGRRAGQRRAGEARRPAAPIAEHRLAILYQTLEVPFGSDLTTIKRGFRRLMRLHHPDLRPANGEETPENTKYVQRVIQAYEELTKLVGGRS